jgi:excisionase family DNA binding protein
METLDRDLHPPAEKWKRPHGRRPWGLLEMRAVQDSNLWPSAPEALPVDLHGAARFGNPAKSLLHGGAAGGGAVHREAGIGRLHAPGVPPPLLSVREVAARLRVSTATVYKLVEAGELPHARIGAAIRVDAEDLAAYVARRRDGGA